MKTPIYLFNTLSHQKEEFKPLTAGKVKIYTCGPTVYNYAHIGNLRAYVFADTLRRMFEFNGLAVQQVINITDVGHLSSDADEGEDKLEKGAVREGKTVWEIAQFYTTAFLADLKKLNIEIPEVMPKATDHINEMIELIKVLEQKGFTYTSEGNVYFDTSKIKDYGKLMKSRPSVDEVQARVETDEHKKHPADFVLWFTRYKYQNHAMMWNSPWGKGFPGWHIECSAMASKYLGEHFDVHTGGIDHIPVHHTNEIAQSEAAFQRPWVNYWLHNDFLEVEGEKMAKSSGEFLRLLTVIDHGFEPLDFRYYLLGGHYRSKMTFSWDGMSGAKAALRRLRNLIANLESGENKVEDCYSDKFVKIINDDLNTPDALALVWETIDASDIPGEAKKHCMKMYDKVLGLDLFATAQIPLHVQELARQRLKLRAEGEWEKSDYLREQINAAGFEVMDEPDGFRLRKK